MLKNVSLLLVDPLVLLDILHFHPNHWSHVNVDVVSRVITDTHRNGDSALQLDIVLQQRERKTIKSTEKIWV